MFNNIKNKINELIENTQNLNEPTDVAKIRDLLSDEYEAISKYGTVASNSSDERVKKILFDIQKEEALHVGELKMLLNLLGYPESETNVEGGKEVLSKLNESWDLGIINGDDNTEDKTDPFLELIKKEAEEKKAKPELSEFLKQDINGSDLLCKLFRKYYPDKNLTEEEINSGSFRLYKDSCNLLDAILNEINSYDRNKIIFDLYELARKGANV